MSNSIESINHQKKKEAELHILRADELLYGSSNREINEEDYHRSRESFKLAALLLEDTNEKELKRALQDIIRNFSNIDMAVIRNMRQIEKKLDNSGRSISKLGIKETLLHEAREYSEQGYYIPPYRMIEGVIFCPQTCGSYPSKWDILYHNQNTNMNAIQEFKIALRIAVAALLKADRFIKRKEQGDLRMEKALLKEEGQIITEINKIKDQLPKLDEFRKFSSKIYNFHIQFIKQGDVRWKNQVAWKA